MEDRILVENVDCCDENGIAQHEDPDTKILLILGRPHLNWNKQFGFKNVVKFSLIKS